jgi:hypothetical protein
LKWLKFERRKGRKPFFCFVMRFSRIIKNDGKYSDLFLSSQT